MLALRCLIRGSRVSFPQFSTSLAVSYYNLHSFSSASPPLEYPSLTAQYLTRSLLLRIRTNNNETITHRPRRPRLRRDAKARRLGYLVVSMRLQLAAQCQLGGLFEFCQQLRMWLLDRFGRFWGCRQVEKVLDFFYFPKIIFCVFRCGVGILLYIGNYSDWFFRLEEMSYNLTKYYCHFTIGTFISFYPYICAR